MKTVWKKYSITPSTNTITLNSLTSPLSNLNLLYLFNETVNVEYFNPTTNNNSVVASNSTIVISGSFPQINVNDSLFIVLDLDDSLYGPASENSLAYLKNILKKLDTLSAVDSLKRQRVTVDSITAGVTLPTITTVGTITTVSTVTSVTTVSTVTTCGTVTTVGSVTNIANLGSIDPKILYRDVNRLAIQRSNII
jgi:hypothetical protein